MKHRALETLWPTAALPLFLPLVLFAVPPAAGQGEQPGSIEFTVTATPTRGRPEPAVHVPVLLLTKSFAEIRKEAEESIPAPDLDQFVDSLEVSPELKAWMKRTRTVELTGPEFMRQLKTDDFLDVPEFFDAYIARNAVDVAVGFPKPKFRERDRQEKPEKYERQRKEYRDDIRKFLETYPHSRNGFDLHLVPLDPGSRWSRQQADRTDDIRRRGLQWANTRYLVARAETDIQGQAGFVNVPPGQYWLSTLDREVAAGDVRFRWDLPVTVDSGRVTRIALTNYNAVPRERRDP